MVSFFAFDTRPRIPAIWLICIMLPRAPELTMTQTGLVVGKLSTIAWLTSARARVQISMSSPRRSVSVMTPRSYWRSILAASSSCRSRIACFDGGVTTSSMAIVMPARVAQWNPADLRASSVAATCTLG